MVRQDTRNTRVLAGVGHIAAAAHETDPLDVKHPEKECHASNVAFWLLFVVGIFCFAAFGAAYGPQL